jgi:hypothetical protein
MNWLYSEGEVCLFRARWSPLGRLEFYWLDERNFCRWTQWEGCEIRNIKDTVADAEFALAIPRPNVRWAQFMFDIEASWHDAQNSVDGVKLRSRT